MNDMNAEALLRLRSENAELRAKIEDQESITADYLQVCKQRDNALLQNDAMRRALTDVMQFSEDERSKAVAKGILDAHGGPDLTCVVKPKCETLDPSAKIGPMAIVEPTLKRIEEPLFLCRAAAYDVISRGLTPCPNKMPCAQHKPCEVCGRPTGGCCTVAVQR